MKAQRQTVYLPDMRGVRLETRYGCGNSKIGESVFTYSRLPGRPRDVPLGIRKTPIANATPMLTRMGSLRGTCPGSTPECEAMCFAARPVAEQGAVFAMWTMNTATDHVPPIPEACRLLRIHVGGDFDSLAYIASWRQRLLERPDIRAWAYTRSWRVPELLGALEELQALPNLQLFASMDRSLPHEEAPTGWRRAWIDGDERVGHRLYGTLDALCLSDDNQIVFDDGASSYVCPEETGRKPDCERCRYCFDGTRHDVTFLLRTSE